MRIAVLHPDLGLGGAERLIVDAAAGLAKRVRKMCIAWVTISVHAAGISRHCLIPFSYFAIIIYHYLPVLLCFFFIYIIDNIMIINYCYYYLFFLYFTSSFR